MIPIMPVDSTLPPNVPPGRPFLPHTAARRALLAGASAMALSGCVGMSALPGPDIESPTVTMDAFVMPDAARLPYRTWLPEGPPVAVILALHGFNDSRDAWEIPSPAFTAAGMAIYAPDQRGFGAAPGRGLWPGTEALVDDAGEMARLLRLRHPGTPVFVMGESMGGAIAMTLATHDHPPEVDGYVLLAPAVWGRARMNIFMRSGLWLAANLVPGLALGSGPVRVRASDNMDALIRLGRDPLTIHETRFDTLRGLVNLMDHALDASRRFAAPGLFLYGDKDELVPKDATLAAWRALPPEPPSSLRLGFYPNGYHLLFRDLDRHLPINDVIAWIGDRSGNLPKQSGGLPSGADKTAQAWLASQA